MTFKATRAKNFPEGEWWNAAAKAPGAPAAIRGLLDGKTKSVDVSEKEAGEIEAWAAKFPGWEARVDENGGACRPIAFEVTSWP